MVLLYLDKNVTNASFSNSPNHWNHRIFINEKAGLLTAHNQNLNHKDDAWIQVVLTHELIEVLNNDTVNVTIDTRDNYLRLIEYCIGDDLRNLGTTSQGTASQGTKDLIQKFCQVNKFTEWIVPKYNIQTKWQPVRKKNGKAVKGNGSEIPVKVVPSDFSQQMERMLLLLGASEAGNKEGNLNEFTSILDTMRNNKKLSKKGYQILLQRFHN